MQHVDSGCMSVMHSLKQSTFLTSGLFPNVFGSLWPCKANRRHPAAPPSLSPLCSVISNLIPYFYVCSFQIFIIFNLYSKSVHLPVWDKSDILFPSSSSIPGSVGYLLHLPLSMLSHFRPTYFNALQVIFEVNYEVIFFWLPLDPPPLSFF